MFFNEEMVSFNDCCTSCFATACGDEKKDTANEEVTVDEGLLNVEITMPANMFEGQDLNFVAQDLKEDGINDVIINDDGSLTYIMSKAKHKEMLNELEDSIKLIMDEIKAGELYPSIKDITTNKKFNEYTLLVDKAQYEGSMDSLSVFTIALSSMYYQLFSGIEQGDYKVIIHLKDKETNEEFNTMVLPDDLENM